MYRYGCAVFFFFWREIKFDLVGGALLLFFFVQFIENLENIDEWEAKKRFLFSKLPAKLMSESVNRLLDRAYNAANHLLPNKISPVKLRAKCVSIRCANDLYELDDSYGLSEVGLGIELQTV